MDSVRVWEFGSSGSEIHWKSLVLQAFPYEEKQISSNTFLW
jgi:hypothetical protein